MAVFQRANGRWSAQVYDPAKGRSVSTAKWTGAGTFATEPAAIRAVRRAEKAIAKAGDSSRTTIGEWRALWLEDGAARWKGKTPGHYRERTKQFGEVHGRTRLVDFGPEQAVRWALEHPSSVPTIRNMFGRAVDLQMIGQSPWHVVPRPPKQRRLRPGFLSEAQVTALADAARQRFGDWGLVPAGMILTSAWTCVRPSELFELRRGDVDFKAGELSVWRAVTSAGIQSTKTEDVRRIVLPPVAATAIRAAMPVVDGLEGGDLLFCNTRGEQWSQPGWHHKWSLIRAMTGMDHLVYYDLRHFGATWLLEHGASKEDVADQLGHQDGGLLVSRVYGHPDRAHSRARIAKLFEGEAEARSAGVEPAASGFGVRRSTS